jgi:hypothetical protein
LGGSTSAGNVTASSPHSTDHARPQLWAGLGDDPATRSGLWRLGVQPAPPAVVAPRLLDLYSGSGGAVSAEQNLGHLRYLAGLEPAALVKALGERLGAFPVLAQPLVAGDAAGEEGSGSDNEDGSQGSGAELLPAQGLMLPLPSGCEDLAGDLLSGGTRIVHKVGPWRAARSAATQCPSALLSSRLACRPCTYPAYLPASALLLLALPVTTATTISAAS